MKDFITQITINNSGLNFEDDISLAVITVPDVISKDNIREILNKIDKEFHNEEDDEGNYIGCHYAEHGYNSDTLLKEMHVRTGWTYKYIYPEISFTIN